MEDQSEILIMSERVAASPFVSLLKDKFLAGFIVVCILLNGFVPRFSIQSEDYEILTQIIASQSILLHFLSLSSLPEKIVNDIFKERTSPQTPQKQQPAKQHTNSANSASDFTLTGTDTRGTSSRCSLLHRIADFDGQIIGAVPVIVSDVRRSCGKPLSGESSVFLLFIMFLFLLPRSNLADGAVVRYMHLRRGTRLDFSSRVFYLIKNNFYGSPL